LAPKEGDPILDQQKSIVLIPTNFQLKALEMSSGEDASYLKEVPRALHDDLFVENIRKRLHTNDVNDEFEFKDGLLYFKGLLYIPPGLAQFKIIQMCYNLPATEHFGFNKTMELISRDFWWPQIWKLVKEFIQSCDTCARGNVPRHRPYGFLHPLPVPKGPWLPLSMDFITDLPLANRKDSIFVVVLIFIVFMEFQIISIVLDRWTQFTFNFLRGFFQLLGVKINFSTAYHPQTDGQIERVNKILEQYLHCTINYQ
jgi:hypothetical protein